MKKLILTMVLVFVTGISFVKANNEVNKSISEEISPPGWTCEEWSDFVFEWVGLDHTFEEAATAGQSAFDNCVN